MIQEEAVHAAHTAQAYRKGRKQVRYPRVLEICAELGLEIIPTRQRLRAGQTKAESVLHGLYEDHGEGHLVLLLRTLLETEGNSAHINDFVLRGLSDVMLAHPEWPQKGLAWLEAFDSIDVGEVRAQARANRQAVPQRHGVAAGLFRELARIFAEPLKPERPRAEKKLPRAVTRIAENRAKIELGRTLLALREQTPNNRRFGGLLRNQFDLEVGRASEAMRVCRLYGDRVEISSRLSWAGLLALSASTLSEAARSNLEQRIARGEQVSVSQILAAGRNVVDTVSEEEPAGQQQCDKHRQCTSSKAVMNQEAHHLRSAPTHPTSHRSQLAGEQKSAQGRDGPMVDA